MPAQPLPPPPPGPPLLLTKRLIAFLNSTLSPVLTTSFLATPSGKLLAHASSDPTSTIATLRTRATVAALLWDIHAASSNAAAEATAEGSRRKAANGGTAKKPSTITVQLERAVVVVRRLVCGIFYVAIGPIDTAAAAAAPPGTRERSSRGTNGGEGTEFGSSPAAEGVVPHSHAHPATSSSPASHASHPQPRPHRPGGSSGSWGETSGLDHQLATSVSPPTTSTTTTPVICEPHSFPTSNTGGHNNDNNNNNSRHPLPPPSTAAHTHTHPHVQIHGHSHGHLAVGSPPDSVISAGASSVASAGAQGAVVLRRQAEDVAQKLDVKLGSLRVPGERIGVEFVQ